MGEIIAALSGKGGTGKTSACAGLAIALAEAGKRVLCIDCDVGLRNLDISLGLADGCALSFLDVSEGGYSLEDSLVHPSFPTLSFLTAPMNRPVEQIDVAAFGEMLRRARRRFDYVMLDAGAGVDAGFRLAATHADRCILVTGPGPAAVRDAARVAEILGLMGKPDVRMIVNRVQKSMLSYLKMTVDDVMDTTGVALLGVVLEDDNVVLAAACGVPLARYSKRCAANGAYRRIARRIQGIPEPIIYR